MKTSTSTSVPWFIHYLCYPILYIQSKNVSKNLASLSPWFVVPSLAKCNWCLLEKFKSISLLTRFAAESRRVGVDRHSRLLRYRKGFCRWDQRCREYIFRTSYFGAGKTGAKILVISGGLKMANLNFSLRWNSGVVKINKNRDVNLGQNS